jgi:para-aminobenzoate synthetase/4-amino-4-deoxychorismate lyase
VEVESREAPRAGVVSLHSLRVAGGLGAHKWVDRSLLDQAQAGLPDGGLPLVMDVDGAALEASRANLFAVRDGALFTASLDGRILPGVTRARVLAIADSAGIEAREEPLSRDDLRGADQVFLTGSVRGIEPVAALDGAPLRRDGGLAERIAAELWRAWADAGAPALFG